MSNADTDYRVRLAAFQFLDQQVNLHGEVLPRSILQQGFEFDGARVPLISPQGIFTPRILDIPLTICTVPPSLRHPPPYADEANENGLLLYRYRGTDVQHRDNVGLRQAMKQQLPLAYLYGIVPGEYLPIWPVFIVDDNPAALTFTVAVDEKRVLDLPTAAAVRESGSEAKRRYITVEVQQRLHQRSFRDRILKVYHERCAVCQLRHRELLEAAHILPDKDPRGIPDISNGISLCKLHHAAFDSDMMGIRPDYHIELREDVRKERDGPMLFHGLQATHGQLLHIPRPQEFRPNPTFLEIRYEEFRKAG